MSNPTGTPFDQGPLGSANVTARLLVLESLILQIAAVLEAEAARQNGLTLDGVRNRIAAVHSEMIDDLLKTNQGSFDAGVPYAATVSHKLFAAVKTMMQASAKKLN
ncbi:hypothetical protein HPT29_028535 (plasmid) [Microvirga terrae]|uniref:Uncharacterized protein n=1 Tax=Microvirga terrae TaxID=2740529 RepID=A0ABY5S2Y9_9HYPH|nr:hypothetical protein [Microvirga terrae]UVF22851.1 hypothetical protein HPT29_028535 [Microvirga terrae]